MELMSLLKERQLSVYQCAKESHVPYTTLSDIVKGKTRIEKCTAETISQKSRLSKARGLTFTAYGYMSGFSYASILWLQIC